MKIRKTAVRRTRKGATTSEQHEYEISGWDLVVLTALVVTLLNGDTAGFFDLMQNLGCLPR